MINGIKSAATLGRTSVRYEIARANRLGRPLCDTRGKERDGREADSYSSSVKLPLNIYTFDPFNDYHTVLAWCLNLRGDLDDRERRFLVSALLYHGGIFHFAGQYQPVQQVRDIFNLLWAYKARWEEKTLRRHERLRTLNPMHMTQTQVRQLTNWVRLQLANIRAVA